MLSQIFNKMFRQGLKASVVGRNSNSSNDCNCTVDRPSLAFALYALDHIDLHKGRHNNRASLKEFL